MGSGCIVGGILGSQYGSTIGSQKYEVNILSCYNKGNISALGKNNENNYQEIFDTVSTGGICGSAGSYVNIKNCYNVGDCSSIEESYNDYSGKICGFRSYAGGITGNSGKIYNCYNVGNVNAKGENDCYAGAIYGNYSSRLENCYYLDTIEISGKNINKNGNESSEIYMISKDFYNTLNVDGVWKYVENDYPKLIDKDIIAQIKESTQITLENDIKKFKITTDVFEVDNIKGGSISGEDEEAFEIINMYEANTKEIMMIPDDGYGITDIKINGESIEFVLDETGSYTIFSGYFTNIQEDKNIVVTYTPLDQILTINKVDKDDNSNVLEGAKFLVDADGRTEITNEIGMLTANGKTVVESKLDQKYNNLFGELTANGVKSASGKFDKEITGVLGNLTSNGTYYFVEENGIYSPNNYSINNSTANSYIKIDLSAKTGEFAVVLNTTVSTNAPFFAHITNNPSAVDMYNPTDRFIYVHGVTNKTENCISQVLEGGNVYYLHLGYLNVSYYDNSIKINNIKVFEVESTTYNFVEKDGKYISNNQGNDYTVASSYIPIDLTNLTGKYNLHVNAEISSQYVCDYGGVVVTQDTSLPTYTGFINISGTQAAKDYITTLTGGNMYYVHFTYSKDGSTSLGSETDTFTINSVNLYGTKEVKYNFVEKNGRYISNNQNKDNTIANSYIPIDLTNCTGKYNLKVNAEISSQYGDYGYVNVTNTTSAPSYSSSSGRVLRITGTQKPQDYTTVLNGGKMYYLHLGYYKNASISSGTDTFTINKIELSLNKDDYFYEEYTTNKYGQIKVAVPLGKYKITELKAPEGYSLNSTPIEIEILAGQENTITITNQKLRKVIVHHYLKNPDGTYTTLKLAEDEIYEGDLGTNYTTSPRVDLVNLGLEKDSEGNFVIPENATGVYTQDAIEVNYYYETEPIKLKIHHYLDGTENKLVPDEIVYVDSEVIFDEEGNYSVQAKGNYIIKDNEKYDNLLKQYDLTSLSTTVQETVEIEDVLEYITDSELSYYYKLKEYSISTKVELHAQNKTNPLTNIKEELLVEGGTISGMDEETYEAVIHGENSTKEIVIKPDDNYIIEKVTLISTNNSGESTTTILYGENHALDAEVTCISQDDGSMLLTGFVGVVEDKEIIVKLAPLKGTIIVHHYIAETGEEYGTTPEKIVLPDGTICENEVKEEIIGESYATKPVDGSEIMYELVATSGETNGQVTAGEKHVYYYYKRIEHIITTDIIEHEEIDESGNVVQVKGGTISGEDVIPYETVLKFNSSTKEIRIVPEDTYRIKKVLINDEEISLDKVGKDKSLLLDLFESVEEDLHIQVEFEKIPTKVIVKYKDIATKENIKAPKVLTGIIDTPYDEQRVEIKNYIPAEPEPTNTKGLMTEEDIIITYWYTRQFEVTTKVQEHEEIDSSGNKVKVKGGTIIGEDKSVLEIVTRGENSTQSILIKPDKGYRIKNITINDRKFDFKDLEKSDKTVELPIFENMQLDKDIVVEFERIPAKVIIKYLEEGTEKVLSETDIIKGYIFKPYETGALELEGYELVKSKLPNNSKGTMTEEDILVCYYYKKIEKVEDKPVENDKPIDNDKPATNDKVENDKPTKPSYQTSNKYQKVENVKTGDNIFGFILILNVSSIVLIIIKLNKKK